MLDEFARRQLHFIFQRYGQSIIDEPRRCKGLLKDLAPKHQRETNLLLLVLEHRLITELLKETQLPLSLQLDRLAQRLHDNIGIQKDFALWAVESWAIALDLMQYDYFPLNQTINNDVRENERLYELGEKFYKNKEYDKAIKWYKLSAVQGYVNSQYSLGWMHERGYGVEVNIVEAIKWYRLAAEKGSADAQLNLGGIYINGRGVPQSALEAVNWYRLAAEQGKAFAQYNLALMYENAWGVARSDNDAFKWHQLAADQAIAESQKKIGDMYYFGIGTEVNMEQAFKWLRLSANQGNVDAINQIINFATQGLADAQFNLGSMYYFGFGFQINELEGFKWWCSAAEQGYMDAITQITDIAKHGFIEAQYYLGKLYYLDKNYKTAYNWWLLAAEQGHSDSQFELAYMYASGINVEKNYAKALNLYRLAAEKGNPNAQCNLGQMYEYGLGIPQCDLAAMEWYRLAAHQSNKFSEYLGWMYEKGKGTELNYEKAIDFYIDAAKENASFSLKRLIEYGNYVTDASYYGCNNFLDLGHKAQINLGELYYFGTAVIEKNEREAFKWFRLAALDFGYVYNFLVKLANSEECAEAQYSLGWIHNIYCKEEDAIFWYQLAYNQGHEKAKEELAELYYEHGCEYESSEYVEQDITKAIKYFRLAAEYGHPAAQLVLAETLYHGLGMEAESMKWYQRASAYQLDIIDDVDKPLMIALNI